MSFIFTKKFINMSFIGLNCTFENDNVRNKIADGLVGYVLYHNKVINSRTDQRSYALNYFGDNSFDPYPSSEYITFEDKINSVKTEKTKKFITINPIVKKWLGYLCARVAHECDMVYNDLAACMKSGAVDLNSLDSVMFSKSFEMDIFRLIAKIVGNHTYLLENFMQVSLLEVEFSGRIYEGYEKQHTLRPYNKNIADWISKLLDDFFKVIAVYISNKNWFDRDATVNEKNLPPILWVLAQNTEYHESLSTFFVYVMSLVTEKKEVINVNNNFTFNMTNATQETLAIMATSIETKKSRAKKAEPNKVTVLPPPNSNQLVTPVLPSINDQMPSQMSSQMPNMPSQMSSQMPNMPSQMSSQMSSQMPNMPSQMPSQMSSQMPNMYSQMSNMPSQMPNMSSQIPNMYSQMSSQMPNMYSQMPNMSFNVPSLQMPQTISGFISQ